MNEEEMEVLLYVLAADGRNTSSAIAAACSGHVRLQALADEKRVAEVLSALESQGLVKDGLPVVRGIALLIADKFIERNEVKPEEMEKVRSLFLDEDLLLLQETLFTGQGRQLAGYFERKFMGFGGYAAKNFREVFLAPLEFLIGASSLDDSTYSILLFAILKGSQKSGVKEFERASMAAMGAKEKLKAIRPFARFLPSGVSKQIEKMRAGIGKVF